MENETSAVEKESVVSRELNILSKSTSELCTQVDKLRNRLQGVLKEQPDSVKEGKPEETLTPVPNEIRRQRSAIDNANYEIRSILTRLEL